MIREAGVELGPVRRLAYRVKSLLDDRQTSLPDPEQRASAVYRMIANINFAVHFRSESRRYVMISHKNIKRRARAV